MLAYPIAAVALLLLGQGADATSTPKQKMEFMRAMKTTNKKAKRARKLSGTTPKEFQAELHGNSKRSSKLRKKFMKKATVVTETDKRKLQNQNYNNYQANNAANEYYSDNNNKYKNYNGGDTDDYFAATGEWNNGFGFDVAQYALSYHRCAAVRQFDDEIAAQEDTTSVFGTKNFAIFRFCPESTCMGYQTNPDYAEYLRQQEEWAQEQEDNAQDYKYSQQYEIPRDAEFLNGKWHTKNGGICEAFNDKTGECTQETFYGARGEGCQSNYGEYMIELSDYLQLMLEYQEERFETYCEYCEECMYLVYQVWIKNGGQNRKLSFEEFQGSEEHQKAARELGGNMNGGEADANYYKVCPEYDTCMEYQDMCGGGIDDGLSEYFECTEVERNNGQVAYIAPHCADNGFTVTLGVYADENCNEYIGNSVNIANFLGYELNADGEDELKPWYNSANGAMDILEFSDEDDVCIPCRKADNPYEDSEYEAQSDDQAEKQYNYGDDEINEICESLYEVSARCDKHFRSYTTKTKQAKYAEAVAQEDLACDFIDSVVMGNYNEFGYVNLSDDQMEQTGWLGNSMYASEYGHYITEVTPLQIFGLVATIAICGILAVWSMTLHQSLSKRGPWRPRRGMMSSRTAAETPQAADINRQNSGIVMGRSQSNASYYMT
ncbi:hypothetical protein ACHAXR_006124 [Thalassiosira sp. AJA248-18]